MSSIKRVAVYGGTGNLGPAIVQGLTDGGFEVTLLTRSAKSADALPQSTKVVQVDFTDASAITSALKGNDALISAVGAPGLEQQPFVFEAGIAAGVKWFLPSQFGSDTSNPKARGLPVFHYKTTTQDWLEKQAAAGRLSYVLFNNCAFLDWGLTANFVVNISGGTTKVYNGGDVEFTSTLLSDVGKGVANVLKNPEPYKNKAVYVGTTVTTQNKLIKAARKAGADIKTEDATTEEALGKAYADLKENGPTLFAMLEFINASLYDPSYGGHFKNTISEELGIKQLSEEETDAIVQKLVKEHKA